MRRDLLICLLLAGITFTLYWPARNFDLVQYDDPLFLTDNPEIQSGLNVHSLAWAMCGVVAANWHPVTNLSFILVHQFWGTNPGAEHLVNAVFHALNGALLFLVLRRLTRSSWRSAVVAALFAWHPLRVESVAWIAERKDVLSVFFFLLTLLCYAKAVTSVRCQVSGTEKAIRPPIMSRVTGHVSLFYWLAVLFFALGLMSKAMLVTVPFVLLLLDFWPLCRIADYRLRIADWKPLLVEKIPFFALAGVASVVTYLVQQHGSSMVPVENMPPGARVGNALISYCRYMGKLFWPVDLAVFYPHPGHWPQAQVLLAGGLLVGLTVCIFVQRMRGPYLLVGWLWFLGTLVPVIGLVQVGGQSMADRYTYIPSLGLLILVVWGACELAPRWRHYEMAFSLAGGAAMVVCLVLTRQQLGYWQDSETLFQHSLAVGGNSYIAHNNLGDALDRKGQIDEAIIHYQEAIRLKPDYAKAYNNLGNARYKKGQIDEAIRQYRQALCLAPDYAAIHNNLGIALGVKGQTDEAIRQFQEALRLNPDYAAAHYNFGVALGMKGQTDEAIRQFQEALRLNPDYPGAQNNLVRALEMKNAPAGR